MAVNVIGPMCPSPRIVDWTRAPSSACRSRKHCSDHYDLTGQSCPFNIDTSAAGSVANKEAENSGGLGSRAALPTALPTALRIASGYEISPHQQGGQTTWEDTSPFRV